MAPRPRKLVKLRKLVCKKVKKASAGAFFILRNFSTSILRAETEH